MMHLGVLLTEDQRMRCEAGHSLVWEGRWYHLDRNVVFCASTKASYPRKYYKPR